MPYVGKTPTVGNFVKLDAITTSATTTFNLTNGGVAYSPQSANHCIVSLNGVIQSPNTSFTISGSTIVFASALTSSDVIDFILVLGDVLNIGTPSDATVGFSKITSNLITGATAETSIAGGDQILIYDDSATALRKMTRTNFVAGVGGVNTPAFFAYNNANQSLSYGTDTKVQFQSELYDTNNCFDNSTNYRFTPTTAGKYFLNTSIALFASNNATWQQGNVTFKKNGSTASEFGFDLTGNEARFWNVNHSQVFNANGSTDYFEVYATLYFTSGTGSILYNASYVKTYFTGFKLIE